MTERVAVILAAGKGTRMKSDLAKVLHPFLGRPLIAYPVLAALEAGATRIVVVTGHQGEAVREAVLAVPGVASQAVRFAHQAQQNGTGHAVLCALADIPTGDVPVWILSGDTPMVRAETLSSIADAAAQSPAGLAVGTMQAQGHTGYGRLLRDDRGDPRCIREERDCSPEEFAVTECNAGLYCVSASHLHAELASLGSDNAQGEIYLTDLVEVRAGRGRVATVALDAIEAAGVNTPQQLGALEAEARAR
ncbi:MAG: NTP transferase domain-containing protein [Nannocystaceae bacterium]|nr:NTP transferase domain-containing protein [bacterium]